LEEQIRSYLEEIGRFTAATPEELDQFRLRFLGKKGILNDLFAGFRNVPNEQKRAAGQLLNELKVAVQDKLDVLKASFEDRVENPLSGTDLTRPVDDIQPGAKHPISLVRSQIIDIFGRLGYTVSEGPEIEDDWHNFSALNFPEEHPARDMQDTFFISKAPDITLRTHTSSVQIRAMEKFKPPIRMIFPGRVFRNEAISARAHCIFHQVEGLYIDKNVSFADLKQNLLYFAREMFSKDTRIRLRPSYFPFTEPSGEMDISCHICGGKGCNLCKGTGWLEILGCGMVHPQVLINCNIDPDEYSGFAFGMGIERITMLKYQIRDLRLFFENDVRFLRQFRGAW